MAETWGEITKNVGIFAGARLIWADDALGSPQRSIMTHEAWLRAMWSGGVGAQVKQLSADGTIRELWPFGQPVKDGPFVNAWVSRNSWIASCPACAGQEGVWQPRNGESDWFWCCACGNEAHDGQRLPLRFRQPVADVEAVLMARPAAETRGWYAHETLAGLMAENLAHACPRRAEG